jgi:hypothetical protein
MEKTIACIKCGETKSISEFYTQEYKTKDGIKLCPRRRICKKCEQKINQPKQNEYRKDRYKKDKDYQEKLRKTARDYYNGHRREIRKHKNAYYQKNRLRFIDNEMERMEKLRRECIELLGGKCKKCKNDDEDVLEFDHIIPVRDRKIKRRNLYEIKERPELYQLLCANCHRRKTKKESKLFWEERRRMPILP